MVKNIETTKVCHSSACAARQAVKESHLPALRFKRMYAASESGRSMVEMLGVLAIIAVLSVGALAGYSQAMKKHKMNQTTEQIVSIMQNVQSKMGNSKRVKITSLEEAIKMGIFPEEMVQSATELSNKYQGTVTFEQVTLGKKKVYKLTFNGLPDDVAMQLATMNWSDTPMIKLMFNGSAENTEE